MLKYLFLGIFLARSAHSIFENCDYLQELESDKTYHIFSPGYPYYYSRGTSCRWVAKSPPNTKIYLKCEQFYIPASQECALDKFGVSRNGRIDLSDVEYYCGRGTLDIVSNTNKINLVLLTASYNWSPGGSFFCEMGVKPVAPDPCHCGYTNTMRIVGGSETGVNAYPMMAGLVFKKEELFCGATIISSKFALTAAHCLMQADVKDIGLLVGDHDISVVNETRSAKLYQLQTFYIHPSYNTQNQKNDLALVKVRDPIKFGREVGPVCLPMLNTRDSLAGESVLIMGWGSTEFTGPSSNKLLKTSVDVITNQQCKAIYNNVDTSQICTFKEGKDSCQSDSGGPLLWRDRATGYVKIVGIISYGINCADKYPAVNTRVSSYLDWIKSTTRK